jgi:CMP-N-acetylneuraminic acid synthetase
MTFPSILCVISARGGSKGVPGKNVRQLLGKPVIARAIQTALSVEMISKVVVSTDSQVIADVAIAAGAEVPFIRPSYLAESDTGKFQVWKHALKIIEKIEHKHYDVYVDIDCTNPLIEPIDIFNAINVYIETKKINDHLDAVFTVAQARRNPYFNLVEPDMNGSLKISKIKGEKVLARQRAPLVYEHVAGVYVLDTSYVIRANHLLDGFVIGYEIAEDKAFDIDSELDFSIIEFLLKRRQSNKDIL